MNTMACYHRMPDGSLCHEFRGATVHHIRGHAFQAEPDPAVEPSVPAPAPVLDPDPRPPANLPDLMRGSR